MHIIIKNSIWNTSRHMGVCTGISTACWKSPKITLRGAVSKCQWNKQLSHKSIGEKIKEPVLILDRLDSNRDILVASFNRPDVRNAINFPMIQEGELRAVILRSLHSGIFCAGADLKERISLSDDDYKKWSHTIRQMTKRFSDLSVPSIAAIDGPALGGGLELALMCDIRIAATNARLGLPETGLGIIPGAGGTQRLPRLIGQSRAKELVFTGRKLTGREAEEYGIVNYAVTQNADGDAAYRKAQEIAHCLNKSEET